MRALLLVALVGCTSPRAPRVVDAAVVFAHRSGGDETVDGRVRCSAPRPGEIACSLSHEGERPMTVCFHVEITCLNGERASAEACRRTAPGGEDKTIHAAEGCDAIGEGRVTEVWIIDR